MPGWHATTSAPAAAGDLQVVGIAQEQHPDRTRLFMQWHQMDWPVMADPLNLLGVSAVPITVFVDENGIVRSVNPKRDELATFLATPLESTGGGPEPVATPLPAGITPPLLAGDPVSVSDYLEGLEEAAAEPLSGEQQFRTGVFFRTRFDAPTHRFPGDFAAAVDHWSAALEADPNQYIWRRRLQQYGPRLDKPYPFYDWVSEARAAITARGETPVALRGEPSGAEIAAPAGKPALSAGDADDAGVSRHENPDPQRRIQRDHDGLVQATPVVVRHTDPGRSAYRIHLAFEPDKARDAKWNNESGLGPDLWIPDGRLVRVETAEPGADGEPVPATSDERRTVEFECDRLPLTVTLFFDACTGDEGVCQHLAKDVEIPRP